jgi:hypothetical protein
MGLVPRLPDVKFLKDQACKVKIFKAEVDGCLRGLRCGSPGPRPLHTDPCVGPGDAIAVWCMQMRQREFEEKKKLFESLQNGKPVVAAGRCLEEEEDEEAEPDLEIQVPKHKVKLIIGPGGENIKQIQRRTRTRIQVHSIILF